MDQFPPARSPAHRPGHIPQEKQAPNRPVRIPQSRVVPDPGRSLRKRVAPRQRSLGYRRLRSLGLLVTLVATAIAAFSLESSGPSTLSGRKPGQSQPVSGRATTNATASGIPAAEAGQLPWSLPNPISRLTLLAGSSPNQLVIMGGVTASGSSAAGVYTLDTVNGHLTQLTSSPA